MLSIQGCFIIGHGVGGGAPFIPMKAAQWCFVVGEVRHPECENTCTPTESANFLFSSDGDKMILSSRLSDEFSYLTSVVRTGNEFCVVTFREMCPVFSWSLWMWWCNDQFDHCDAWSGPDLLWMWSEGSDLRCVSNGPYDSSRTLYRQSESFKGFRGFWRGERDSGSFLMFFQKSSVYLGCLWVASRTPEEDLGPLWGPAVLGEICEV